MSKKKVDGIEALRARRAEYQRRWRAKHPEQARESDRLRRVANREKKSRQNRHWNKTHPEKCREYQRRWAEAHPVEAQEKSRANAKRWAKANPEKRREADKRRRIANREGRYVLQHRRRARKRAASGAGWTAADVKAQYGAQKGQCFYCKRPLGKSYHRDHITPLARGGAHCRSNLALACPDCNLHKHARDPQDFAGILL